MSDSDTPDTDPPEDAPPAEEPAAEPAAKSYDETYVKGLRSENAKHRTEKAKLEKELDDLRKNAMSDAEKAVAEAKAAGRIEALAEVGASLVDAKVEALTAGRGVDHEALLEGIDKARFLGEDGRPDVDKLTAWIDRIAPARTDDTSVPKPPVDMGQGTRPANAQSQIRDRAQLKNMTPRQIEQARVEGRLDSMMRGA